MRLDRIDRQILKALFLNGRESLTNLEKSIFKTDSETMSHTGIAKRMQKLEVNEILKIQANSNINALQYKAMFLLMEMSNYGEVQNIINSYKDCPRVFMLAQVTGQYNIIMGLIGQTTDVLYRYLNQCGPTNKGGILHSASIFVSALALPKYLPLNLFSNESQESKCKNNCKNCAALLNDQCGGCGKF